jgi:hypothetical protein
MLNTRPTAGNINSTILPPSQKTSELPYYNMKQAPPEKLGKPVSIVTTRQFPLHKA